MMLERTSRSGLARQTIPGHGACPHPKQSSQPQLKSVGGSLPSVLTTSYTSVRAASSRSESANTRNMKLPRDPRYSVTDMRSRDAVMRSGNSRLGQFSGDCALWDRDRVRFEPLRPTQLTQ
jgi:hypothetical protein